MLRIRVARCGTMLGAVALTLAGSPSLPVGPAAVAQEGRLEGQVVLSSRLSSRRPRFRLYTEYGQGGVVPAAAPADGNEMANVIIYIDSALPGPAPAAARREMRQSGEAFTPHVLAVPAGSTVNFPNADPFFHNVFSLSRPRTFDLGRYPQGESKSVEFDRPGAVQVFCHIHSDMSAVVFVTPSAFFTSPTAGGTYEIRGIPAGTYRVTAWHERTRPISVIVRIDPGQATRLDFNIPITDAERERR